jgi:type IV secretion system protein VirB10
MDERAHPAAGATTGGGPDVGEHAIAGERTIPSVNRARSAQSRMSHAMAVGTVVLITIAAVYWYWSSTFAAQRHAEEVERRSREARAAGEMRPPRLALRSEPAAPAPPAPPPVAPAPTPAPVLATAPPPLPPGAAQKTPQELERDRLLGGGVMLRKSTFTESSASALPVHASATAATGTSGDGTLLQVGAPVPGSPGGLATNPGAGALAQSLRPTPTPAVRAQVLPDRRFLLPKGAFVDCTLETALDSTLPGLATCIAPVDVFSADGAVVLIERGTRFVGETRADVRPGQSRIGVLWNEARTPSGVSVALASPGTDELGRAGLPGFVDRHFWERFGAAILISVVDGTMQAIAAAQRSGPGPTFVTGAPRDIMTEVLRGTINIPPTVVKNQGDRIQILVARDVDFRPVYALRTAATSGE